MKPQDHHSIAKPFLKWAGGKRQLLGSIARFVPPELGIKEFIYIEPFVGSGAVLFWMLAHFPKVERAIISDINGDLIGCYRTLKAHPHDLIDILARWQNEFHALDKAGRKHYYDTKRDLYNKRCQDITQHAALFIFLNRTCFNGLYRVSRTGHYNVPMGDYKQPKICDRENILAVSRCLQKVEILEGDFIKMLEFATPDSFFYLDPPYKPLSPTAHFNAYDRQIFDDDEQIRLHNFCQKLDGRASKWLLSNSDVRTCEGEVSFFDELYANFRIERVMATRRINSKVTGRGKVAELLIRNYS